MKATAIAPANIALIKYWGKQDEKLRLPTNSSVSMNLSKAQTITTVEFSKKYAADRVEFVGETASAQEIRRIIEQLVRLRKKASNSSKARVVTKNNFPKSAGIAASASGFAALTVAGAAALGLKLSEKDLTIFARFGSGSACRSIPDGFVLWEEGKSSETSFARSLYPPDYWDLRDILVIAKNPVKKVSTSEGMGLVKTSPFFTSRLLSLPQRLEKIERALKKKDFTLLGATIEKECLNMHAVMMTQTPPLFYWNGMTMEIMKAVQDWREEGLPVYFTIDAGPNVHLICEAKSKDALLKKIKDLGGIERVIINKPARGAHLTGEHLF